MRQTDARVSLVSETFQSIKTVKLIGPFDSLRENGVLTPS